MSPLFSCEWPFARSILHGLLTFLKSRLTGLLGAEILAPKAVLIFQHTTDYGNFDSGKAMS